MFILSANFQHDFLCMEDRVTRSRVLSDSATAELILWNRLITVTNSGIVLHQLAYCLQVTFARAINLLRLPKLRFRLPEG
jgi:hypothetical protein